MGRTALERAQELLGSVPDEADLVAEIDARIEAANALRVEIEDAARGVREHVGKLEAAKKTLLKVARTRRRAATGERTPLQRAGRGNVEKIGAMLKRSGPLTKAEITQRLGMNNGTVTYALRALEEEGEARKTGVRSATGSDQYEHVGGGRRVSRPGKRR